MAGSFTTEILSIYDQHALVRASALLHDEQVIAAPTDTVYGVMCRYDSVAAIERLYVAKDRPPRKAIPILLGGEEMLAQVSPGPLPELARQLIARFWPGPLTIVVAAHPALPAILTAGQPTVALRVPDHDDLRRLLQMVGPLAATSANRSGAADTTTAAEVLAQLDGAIPLILADDDAADRRKLRMPSTLVDLTVTPPAILRAGPIEAEVRKIVGREVHP
jgi:L-threonylcarbamoyladenylate synthase